MDDATSDLQASKLRWHERVADAKTRWDFAKTYLQEVQADLRTGAVPAPDGNFALQRAMRAENFGLAEYHRTLKAYTDLVLHGKIPDEKEWVRGRGAGEGESR